MNVSRLEKVYIGIVLAIFAGIIIHTPVSVFLSVKYPDLELFIKSWKELLMLIGAILAVVIVSRRQLWGELLRDWLFRIIVLYALLHAVLASLFYEQANMTAAGLAIDLRYVLFFSLVYVVIRIAPQYRRALLQIGGVGAFVIVGFAAMQFFLPPDILAHIGYSKDTIMPYLTVDKNPDYIRVNSTLRGPNPLGAYAGIVLGLLTAAIVRGKLTLQDKRVAVATVILAFCAVAALWLSYSRSALVAGIVTVGIVLAVSVLRRLPRRVWIAVSIIVFALLGALIAGRDSSFVSNVLLHENQQGGSNVSSNEEHAQSLAFGIDRFIHQPLGAGVGSTGSASLYGDKPVIIENQYLFIAHEAGWLGLLLFLALYGVILVRLWRGRANWLCLGLFASGIGLGLIGLLLPVWADDTVSIVWWGLAAIGIGGIYERKKQTK